MHVAAAVGTPSLTLFSNDSDPARCAPRGGAAAHLQRADLVDLPAGDVLAAARRLVTQGRGTWT
jgi:ADP-heptose:LPS heptosyltransferase